MLSGEVAIVVALTTVDELYSIGLTEHSSFVSGTGVRMSLNMGIGDPTSLLMSSARFSSIIAFRARLYITAITTSTVTIAVIMPAIIATSAIGGAVVERPTVGT